MSPRRLAVADRPSLVGQEFELEVGPVAHGGHCVARIPEGPAAGEVAFVRHALPGERVRIRVTEDGASSFCRADAIAVLDPAPERVAAPCPASGPGACGGCDWQHVSAEGQRALKAAVIREQFQRLAGLPVSVTVEELPGGLLGWRTRTVYSVAPDGRMGLLRHRSDRVYPLSQCLIGAPGVGDPSALSTRVIGADRVELARGDDASAAVLAHRTAPAVRRGRGRRRPDEVRVVAGPAALRHHVSDRLFTVAAGGFWQVHPRIAEELVKAVVAATEPRAGETVLDLYAGAGLFTAVMADLVGATGRVVGVEISAQAVADAASNLSGLSHAEVRQGSVGADSIAGLELAPDLVILDPPRAGAGPSVMAAVAALNPRAVCYVACDPASLARDVATAVNLGWRLRALRAFDAFPMTAHIECVALLEPASTRLPSP